MMNTFRKWWLLLAIAVLPLSAHAQSGLRSVNFTTASASSAINNINTGLAYHAMVWHVLGTASVCTVALDTSVDGITWSAGGAITGQTCTSTGGSAVVNVIANYVRINVTALTVTVGSSVSVTWEAWTCNPASCGGGGAGGGIGGTIANTQVATGNGVNTIAGSNLFTFKSATPNASLSLLNASPCSLTQISMFMICSDNTFPVGVGQGQLEVIGGGAGANENAEICVTNTNIAGNTGTSRPSNSCWGQSNTAGGGITWSVPATAGGSGITVQGTTAAHPGTLEVGVNGLVTTTTQLDFIPDGQIQVFGPVGFNGFDFKDVLSPTKDGFVQFDSTDGFMDIIEQDTNTGKIVDFELNSTTGVASIATGVSTVAQSWDASQNSTVTNKFTAKTFGTATNCAANGTGANPSVVTCAAASSGMFSCATAASTGTCQVNTTAVTANSEILITQDAADGGASQLNVTCNTGNVLSTTKPLLLSKNAGVSFTINLGTVGTNPACFEYHIVN